MFTPARIVLARNPGAPDESETTVPRMRPRDVPNSAPKRLMLLSEAATHPS